MQKIALAFFGLVLCGGIAQAESMVGGWEISGKPLANGACLAAREYADKEDGGKKNAVVFGVVKAKDSKLLIVSLSYEGWKWDKGEKVTADLLVDGKKIVRKLKWEGDKETLVVKFDDGDEMINTFGGGKKIVLHFDDGEADFLTPNAGLALGAATLCLDAK